MFVPKLASRVLRLYFLQNANLILNLRLVLPNSACFIIAVSLNLSKTSSSYKFIQRNGLLLGNGALAINVSPPLYNSENKNCISWILAHGDQWTRLAVEMLSALGYQSSHFSPMTALTTKSIQPGYWNSRLLLSFGLKGNACPNEFLRTLMPPSFSESLSEIITYAPTSEYDL